MPVQHPKVKKQVSVRIGERSMTTTIIARDHEIIADEPIALGGNNLGPTPYELLLSSLGACTVITLRMYANRKGWPVKEINVHLSYNKEHCVDCQDPENPNAYIDKMTREIEFIGDVDEAQIKRMMVIANKCPVHKTLVGNIQIETSQLQ